MKKLALLGILILALSVTAVTAGVENRWLHIRVQDDGPDGELVRVNIPLAMVEALLPTIHTDELEGGILGLDDDDLEIEGIDLKEALEAIRNAPDADYVTVQGRDETVRVAKERGFIIVHADETDGERVRVRMPLAIVDALVEGERRGELDLIAALNALADYDGGDLVTIESDDSSVRIWIDSKSDE